jgi:hypothetical protein
MLSGEYSIVSRCVPTKNIAFRICTSVSVAGDRITETGVEEIVKMDRGGGEFPNVSAHHALINQLVPIIVVLTKYDNLVNSAILEAMDDDTLVMNDDELQSYGEGKASEIFETMYVDALAKSVGNVPVTKVSSGYGSSEPSNRTNSSFFLSSTKIRKDYRGAHQNYRQSCSKSHPQRVPY